jgi:hypothetical protein
VASNDVSLTFPYAEQQEDLGQHWGINGCSDHADEAFSAFPSTNCLRLVAVSHEEDELRGVGEEADGQQGQADQQRQVRKDPEAPQDLFLSLVSCQS